MNASVNFPTLDKPLSIAILAMGGQGGGVLTDWIVNVAEANGWYAQSTSVPGVAQRTGATLYYIEMMPPKNGKAPILSLMPTPGDVDVVIASELMEAGRSILRGLATPSKTILITSTHRSYAIVEKEKPGLAIADPRAVDAAAHIAAKRVISFDMDEAARRNGTVISSPILGVLAGVGILPFSRESYEKAISSGGKGAAASLKGFAEGFTRATTNDMPSVQIESPQHDQPIAQTLGHPALDVLLTRITQLPLPAQSLALAGLKRVVDFQDVQYGAEYLDRLEALSERDQNPTWAFTTACAKYLANAMTYDDVIGVADIKTRSTRFNRIETEMKSGDDPIYLTEFMHPRAEEIVSLMPTKIGRWLRSKPNLMVRLDRTFNKGRHIQTAKLRGFLPLYMVSALRRFRRGLLRHADEMVHIEKWLGLAMQQVTTNYGLAVGIIKAQRLIKGYSDTHARGLTKFDRVISAVPFLSARDDAEQWMKRLMAAALSDENGDALDGALKTIKTL